MARFASTIDNQPIYATRALNDKDGNQIDTTYAKLSDIPNVPVQDVTVDGTSVVNAQGVAEITTPTFTQVQADWTEANSAEPSYIQHKPNLAAVATSGDYSDLSNTPSIPTATSDLQNDSGFITSADIPVTDVEVDGVSVVSGGVASITLPSVPVTDVTVNGTSVVSSGTAAVTVPTATSDLTNDSNFITASEAPVQDVTVNGTSVLSNGVAAVTVPTATSDLTNDSGFITASDIPAQVQADWTQSNSAEPSYIQHKPNLAAVAVSGDYSDLSNTPTINNVPAVTSSDDSKVLKASYTGGVGSYSWENETGTTYSAGTGIDIDQNNAISVENPLPSSTSADEGKVLKVDANGDPEWASAQAPISAGNGIDITNNVVSAKVDGTTVTTNSSGELTANIPAQEQSDWTESNTSDPAYILHKPIVKELTAGSNVTITEGTTDITISATDTTYTAGNNITISGGVISAASQVNADWSETDTTDPSYIDNKPDLSVYATTSAMTTALADKQDILTAGTNVQITNNVISATDTTYSAGTGIEITNNEISVETPVDIVAGPGIVIDNPDGNTLRVSMAQDVETVLWNDADGAFAATLNESLFNFEKIKVFQLTEATYHIQEFYTSDLTGNTFTIGATYQALSNQIYCFSSKWSITNSGVNIESTGKGYGLVGTSGGFTFYSGNIYNGKICRIIGVHRINGGN